MAKKSKFHNNYIRLAILIIVIGIGAIGVSIYKWDHKNTANTTSDSGSSTNKPSSIGTPSSPSTAPTPSSVPSISISTSTTNSGGVVDTNGQTIGTLPPSSEWTSSSSGDITLQQPTNGSTIQSGDTISGLADTSTVSFILKDNSVGVIAQGSLNVVNGKFSGTLEFTPHANSGSLEVYYPNPSTGAEEDIINITVNFNA